MRRHWKAIAVLAAVAAVGLSVVAGAWGAGAATWPYRRAGACRSLMSNPQPLKDMRALRAEHQSDMRRWNAQYGADPQPSRSSGSVAKARQSHWDDMKALFEKYGIKAPAGAGPGGAAARRDDGLRRALFERRVRWRGRHPWALRRKAAMARA